MNIELVRSAIDLLGRNDLQTPLTDRQTSHNHKQTPGTVHVLGVAIDQKTLDEALLRRPSCRFEVVELTKEQVKESFLPVDAKLPTDGVRVIMDIAHNADAIKNLVARMDRYAKYSASLGEELDIRIVVGMCADKSVDECLDQLLHLVRYSDDIFCVEARHPRAVPADKLRRMVDERGRMLGKDLVRPTSMSTSKTLVRDASETLIQLGLKQAVASLMGEPHTATSSNNKKRLPIVLVTGSFFHMPDIRQQLGFQEPRDGDILLEVSKAFNASA